MVSLTQRKLPSSLSSAFSLSACVLGKIDLIFVSSCQKPDMRRSCAAGFLLLRAARTTWESTCTTSHGASCMAPQLPFQQGSAPLFCESQRLKLVNHPHNMQCLRSLFDASSGQASSTSSWDVGNPPSAREGKGENKSQGSTPAPSLQKETSTRDLFHAKAKETEDRLSQEGKSHEGSRHDSSEGGSLSYSMIEEEEGKSVWALGMKVTIKCPGERTNGAYTLLEYVLAPGNGSQTHTHSQEDETWYMLDGEMEWTLSDKTFQAKKGCYIHLPSGIPHSFHNKSGNPARMLVTCLPAGLEKYFLETGVPVDPSIDAKRPSVSEEEAQRATSAGRKYGLTFSTSGTAA